MPFADVFAVAAESIFDWTLLLRSAGCVCDEVVVAFDCFAVHLAVAEFGHVCVRRCSLCGLRIVWCERQNRVPKKCVCVCVCVSVSVSVCVCVYMCEIMSKGPGM